MALTPEMMDLLIAEYFFDPYELGYRKYGYMEREGFYVFYIPQILALVNSPRTEVYTYHDDEAEFLDSLDGNVDHDSHMKSVLKKRKLPSRISEIFSNIENAPNYVTTEDVLSAFFYFVSNNPGTTVADYVVLE